MIRIREYKLFFPDKGRCCQVLVTARPNYDKFCTLLTNIVTTYPHFFI